LKGHAGPVYSANFSPDGDYILSASNDCTGSVNQMILIVGAL
jgi:WD40 repeat protein